MPVKPEGGVALESGKARASCDNSIPITDNRSPITVQLWGTGSAFREFLHVDDMADACVFVMETIHAGNLYQKGISHINVGTGEDIPIRDLAVMIKDIVGFKGKIAYDSAKPDGMPKKLLDVARLQSYGWGYKIGLEQGIRSVCRWYDSALISMAGL